MPHPYYSTVRESFAIQYLANFIKYIQKVAKNRGPSVKEKSSVGF